MNLEKSLQQRISGDIFPLVLLPEIMAGTPLYFISLAWKANPAAKWGLATACIFSGQLLLVYFFRSRLIDEAKSHQTIKMGLADDITLTRGFLLACTGGFISIPRPQGWLGWTPGILYLLALAGDGLDGYAARKLKRPTAFGQVLDLEFDAQGTFLGAILAYTYRQVPAWYLLVGFGHYLFSAGIWTRKVCGMPVYSLPRNTFRGLAGVANSFFLTMAMTPILTPSVITFLSIPAFALIAFSFIKDWLVITGLNKADR